jgi:hypothetical protein
LRQLTEDGWQDLEIGEEGEDPELEGMDDVFQDPPSLTRGVERFAQTMKPVDLFFYFMPKSLWITIAAETNKYEQQTRDNRKKEAMAQIRSSVTDPALRKLRYQDRERAIDAFEEIQPVEILHFISLLIARVLSPMKRRLADHWRTKQSGAVPAGTWSRFMTRARFYEINRWVCLV